MKKSALCDAASLLLCWVFMMVSGTVSSLFRCFYLSTIR